MDVVYRILVIEDLESDFALLSRHFKLNGRFRSQLHRVDTQQEFELLLNQEWDAILSDYNVPGFGAVPALSLLKSRELDIPLIIVSGEVGEEKAVEIMHAGADDFVRKDNLARLIPALERSIQVSHMRKRKKKLRIAHERALHDRERLMDVVCHDIKNPLSSVRLACQLLLEKAKAQKQIDSSLVTEITETIMRSSERVNRLVRDLLEQSRIESGLFGIHSRKVLVSTFLNEVVEAFRPIALNNNIKLKIELLDETLEGHFDRDRIFQVIGNLLSNALKFSPANSTIVIGAEKEEKGLKFFVRDQGPGISETDSPLVFSKFFQGKSHKFKGHGLGLWIAHEIVRAHAGEIGFYSATEGTGTTFWFSLPFQPIAEAPATQPSTSAPHILVVDDDEDLTETIHQVLNVKDVPCQISHTYEKAVEILQKEEWSEKDIVLIDYDLPGKNGGELVEWMRYNSSQKSLPKIVLMSAHPDIHERAENLKVKHYLKKPMNIDEIFELVK